MAPNDDSQNFTTLSGLSGQVTGTSSGATAELNDPSSGGKLPSASLWYGFTNFPNAGQLRVDTHGSQFDTTLGVYSSFPSSGVPAKITDNDNDGSADGTSTVYFATQSGGSYYIQLDGDVRNTPNHVLSWSFVSNPVANISANITSSGQAYEGYNFSYFGSVSNAGPNAATNVVVTLTLTANQQLLSKPAECTSVGLTITCNIGTVPPASTYVVEIIVRLANTGTAGVTMSASSEVSDSSTTNNSSSLNTVVTVQPPEADVPTLPEWGMIFLASMLVMTALSAKQRRN